MRKPPARVVEAGEEPTLVLPRERDLEAILAIEREAFESPWKREHFLYELNENPHARNYVLRSPEGALLGYAFTWELGRELLINNIALHRDSRGRGLGRRFLGRILELGRRNGCRLARLDVRPSNRPAVELYSRAGFRVIGIRPGYYGEGREDGWVMVRSLRDRLPSRPSLKDDFP